MRKTGLTKGRVSQLLDEEDKEPFGERAARSLAVKLGLTPDYFEKDHTKTPPPPPKDFHDRHVVSDSDLALLNDIKDAMASPQLAKQVEALRAELAAMKEFAESVYRRRVEEAQERGGYAGGMSVFGELDDEPEEKRTPAKREKGGRK